MNVYLTRHAYTRWGTLGRLRIGGESIPTLEPPWRENKPFISCIPEGTYRMEPQESPKFRRVLWSITNGQQILQGRIEILIHAGNTVADTAGCILVGTRDGIEANALRLYSGKRGERRLAALLAGHARATLHISKPDELGRLTLDPSCGH